jgi:hypothetical protein
MIRRPPPTSAAPDRLAQSRQDWSAVRLPGRDVAIALSRLLSSNWAVQGRWALDAPSNPAPTPNAGKAALRPCMAQQSSLNWLDLV